MPETRIDKMADVLQKLLRGTGDAAIIATLVAKELGMNETDRNMLYKHLDGVTIDKFFSENTLAKVTGTSGGSLIGVDNTSFTELSASNVQSLMVEIDGAIHNIAYIIVETQAELITALELTTDVAILTKGVGLTSGNADVTKSKRIYSLSRGNLEVTGTATTFSVTLPSSGGDDIFIDFYADLTSSGSGVFSVFGGFAGGHTHKVRFTYTEKNIGSGLPNVILEYESTIVSQSNAVLTLWSGVTQGKSDVDTTVTPTIKHVVVSGEAVNVATVFFKTTDELDVTATVGKTHHLRRYTRQVNIGGAINTQGTIGLKDDAGLSTFILQATTDYTTLLNVMTLNGNGQMSLDQLLDPWDKDIQVLTIGPNWASYTFNNTTTSELKSGQVQHAYCTSPLAGEVWKFTTSGVLAYKTEYIDGIQTEFVSDATGAIDVTITWILASYDNTFRRMNYTWDGSSTTDADPGTGKIRGNNVAYTGSTELYVNDTDLNGIIRNAQLDLSGQGGVSRLASILIWDRQFHGLFNITTVTDQGGYTKFAGSIAKRTGGLSIPNNNGVVLELNV